MFSSSDIKINSLEMGPYPLAAESWPPKGKLMATEIWLSGRRNEWKSASRLGHNALCSALL